MMVVGRKMIRIVWAETQKSIHIGKLSIWLKETPCPWRRFKLSVNNRPNYWGLMWDLELWFLAITWNPRLDKE
ncbi:MAG: hypothetical protein G01um1014107_5 [Parcubacteria group bacterium Gr01-1014_107]|nr:MAG: hypothetical protein G01um1014107_5 [Parcubacteria group bacterium Gr01-1014_107]